MNTIATHHYDEIDSTQSQATRLMAGHQAPFWVTATEQTAGRGRQGRAWFGTLGNYFASLVWPAPANIADAPKVSLVTAFALYKTLRMMQVPNLSVKWPNDVLADGHKLAGILLEKHGENLVIGVGVNLVSTPSQDALEARALAPASLDQFLTVDALVFHHAFGAVLVEELNHFDRNGFDRTRKGLDNALWVRADMIYDDGRVKELVRVHSIADDGALLVCTDQGQKRIYAGDLWPYEGANEPSN